MRVATMLLVLHVSSTVVAADDLMSCATIKSDAERLQCYDKTNANVGAVLGTSSSKWIVDLEKSKIDDSPAVYASLASDDTFADRFSAQQVVGGLWIRCVEGVTSLMVTFGDHHLDDRNGRGDVVFRLDANKAVVKKFVASSDNSTLGLWPSVDAIPVIRDLLNAKQMTVRVVPYGQNPITATFTLNGVADVVNQVRAACSW